MMRGGVDVEQLRAMLTNGAMPLLGWEVEVGRLLDLIDQLQRVADEAGDEAERLRIANGEWRGRYQRLADEMDERIAQYRELDDQRRAEIASLKARLGPGRRRKGRQS